MDIVRLGKNLVEIDKHVRVEAGFPRRKEVATKELLHNHKTASHYCEGKIDALGKPICLGEEMDYIDWKCNDECWYVYKLEDEKCIDKDDKEVTIERYKTQGCYDNYEAALSHAINLAQGEE